MNLNEMTIGQVKEINDLMGKKEKVKTFLEVGKGYLFRTVTMIYTGRIKAMSGQEILLDEAAWIPDTERWMNTLKDSIFKEVEPYPKPVIIFRGAILDVTELDSLPREQK